MLFILMGFISYFYVIIYIISTLNIIIIVYYMPIAAIHSPQMLDVLMGILLIYNYIYVAYKRCLLMQIGISYNP